jgi:hypothetical protein
MSISPKDINSYIEYTNCYLRGICVGGQHISQSPSLTTGLCRPLAQIPLAGAHLTASYTFVLAGAKYTNFNISAQIVYSLVYPAYIKIAFHVEKGCNPN